MPTGPNSQKRFADVVSNAIHIAKIAIGELADPEPKTAEAKKSAANKSLRYRRAVKYQLSATAKQAKTP